MTDNHTPVGDGSPPSFDDLLLALADGDRRRLLFDLLEEGSQTLGGFVAANTAGRNPDHLRLRLQHQHLPKLEESGLIRTEQDGESRLIHQGAEFDAAAPLLELFAEHEARLPGTLR